MSVAQETSHDIQNPGSSFLFDLSLTLLRLKEKKSLNKRLLNQFAKVIKCSLSNSFTLFCLKRGQQTEATTVPSELGLDIPGQGILHSGGGC